MNRRTLIRATTGSIAAAGVPTAVSARGHDSFSTEDTSRYKGFVVEVASKTYLTTVDMENGAVKVDEVDENEEIAEYRISSIKKDENETQISKKSAHSEDIKISRQLENINKNNMDDGGSQIKQFKLKHESQIRSAVEKQADTPEIIERTESYARKKEGDEDCKNDCNHHWLMGTSMKFNGMVAEVSKSVIVAAILGALASSGSGALASIFGNNIVEGIVGAVASQLVDNSLSLARYDYDLNYKIGSKKMTSAGYGIGPWKPGKSEIIEMATMLGHSPRCDWS
ncbi:hypothetical protein [Natrinema pallidum]|uniref:Uncharacterized protein n=1 Tax=Natrinema pallidum TaxID=69527 RepID=A0A4P9TC81_9EURY|nr:hypothetical protein [Natrinema pallidum]QCW02286.1 hypothetical protein FGF80_03130 [Natrinema pallidum]